LLSNSPLGRVARLPHLASLKHKDFRYTWLATLLSSAGMWMFLVAANWLAFERSESSAWVGITTFAAMLPFLIASPIAGVLADRMNRRNMAALSFGGEALAVGSLTVVVFTGHIQLWHLAVVAFVSGVFRTTAEPSVQALITNQVPRADLLNAITLNAMTRHGARLFGLLAGAPLLAVDAVGANGVLVMSASVYVLGTLAILRCTTVSRGDAIPGQTAVKGLLEGLSFIYRNQTIALFILLVAFHCALVMSFDSILPIFSKEQLGATDGSIFGYLVMGFGAGSMIGTLIIAGIRDEKLKGQMLLWTGVASGLAPVVFAFMGHFAPALLLASLMGASQATFMAITNAYVLSITPDRLRGRVISLYTLHAGGVMAFANLGYGFLADYISSPLIFIVTGLIFLVFVVSLMGGQPILRRVCKTGQVSPIAEPAPA